MDNLTRVYRQEEGLLVPTHRRRLGLGIAAAILGPLVLTPIATHPFFAQLPALPFVLAVVLATLLGRLAAGMVAVLTSMVLIDYYVISPHVFRPHSVQDLFALFMFTLVTIIVARLTARLENARSDARRERERLTLLAGAGDTLGSSLDYETTIRELGHYLVPMFADWCSVDLLEARGTIENLVVAHRDPAKLEQARDIQRRHPPDPDAPTGIPNVVRSGKAELVPEITDEMLPAGISDPAELQAIQSLGLRSAMIAPLTADGRTFGAVTFGAESGFRYTEKDLELAQEIAHRAAIAITNARAYQAETDAKAWAEEAAARNAILLTVTAALGMARTRTEVADSILTQGLTAAGASAGVVGLLDGHGQIQIVAIAGYDLDDQTYWRSFNLSDPYPLADAVRERGPVVMTTVTEREAGYPLLAGTGLPEDHPLVCMPLMLGEEAIGGISASFPPGSVFGEDRLAFLGAIAGQAAQAIDRANAYDREQEARSQLDRLARISQALAVTLDFEATTKRVLELAAANLGTEAVLYLLEGKQPSAAGRARRDPDKSVVIEALKTEARVGAELAEDIAAAARDGVAKMLGEDNAMVLPLVLAGHVTGVLVITGIDPSPTALHQDPLVLPREVARLMARALENAGAYRDRDHIARTLQNSLLPPALPQVPHLEIAAVFKPALDAYEIGGDFYDVFQTPDGRWAAVIGDVCGKGIEAAALTSLARYTLRATFRTGSPSDALRALNDALLQEALDGKFCTVCVVLVEPGPGGAEMIVASAGHPLPQLVRPDGSSESVGHHGTLLGVTEQPRLVDVRSRLAPGDTLVLYTDGLLERYHQHLDETEQLRPALEPRGDPTLGVKERIERYVEELTADQQDDDVAVLLLTARA